MLVHQSMSYVFNAVSYCNTDNIFKKLPPFCFEKNNCKTSFRTQPEPVEPMHEYKKSSAK